MEEPKQPVTKIKIGAFWMRQKEDGSVSTSGKIEIDNVQVYPNDYWEEGSNKPTHIIWAYPRKKKDGPVVQDGQTNQQSIPQDGPQKEQNPSYVDDKIPF